MVLWCQASLQAGVDFPCISSAQWWARTLRLQWEDGVGCMPRLLGLL